MLLDNTDKDFVKDNKQYPCNSAEERILLKKRLIVPERLKSKNVFNILLVYKLMILHYLFFKIIFLVYASTYNKGVFFIFLYVCF